MTKQNIKKKYLFLGDVDSINIELVIKSFGILRNKVNYILICNKKDLLRSNYFKRKKIEINEILDPISFLNYNKNKLNVFNINNISKKKYLNLLNQIQISNNLANSTKYDLITMPIDKSIFKKKINFTGLTEYFGNINKKTTVMLMHGDKFSVIPMTTHINLKNISKYLNSRNVEFFIKNIFNNLKKKIYDLNFTDIKFLCYNPHCGEDNTLGNEDIMIKKIIKKKKRIKGIFSADSIFNNFKINSLFISTYHDQALIPFKILNKKSLNLTLGLNYRRLSPAHGVARDIKKKYIADNTSYLKCLLF